MFVDWPGVQGQELGWEDPESGGIVKVLEGVAVVGASCLEMSVRWESVLHQGPDPL